MSVDEVGSVPNPEIGGTISPPMSVSAAVMVALMLVASAPFALFSLGCDQLMRQTEQSVPDDRILLQDGFDLRSGVVNRAQIHSAGNRRRRPIRRIVMFPIALAASTRLDRAMS